jgi:hypothetical protein
VSEAQEPDGLGLLPGALGVFGGKLERPQAGDLGTDPRAVGGKEGEQSVVARVAASSTVRIDQLESEPLEAEPGQVHDQERDVRSDVDLPQFRTELDAVVDVDGAVCRHDDVLGPKVTVAVADQPP